VKWPGWIKRLGSSSRSASPSPAKLSARTEEDWARVRAAMVQDQISRRGVLDSRVLSAMEIVPRHLFVPEKVRARAYHDEPLPIGHGQTISQPYVVAAMVERLHLLESARVLEVGTGSGYQAAVLSRIVSEVDTVEVIPELAQQARETLRRLSYANVDVRTGNGWEGWLEKAPFDGIIVAAGLQEEPTWLLDQLKVGGRLIAPQGGRAFQTLRTWTRTPSGWEDVVAFTVRFVPFVKPPDGERLS
jgi:protein-L-isoaspartate(D-aspartate) O-methyltransferase